jgi:regulator of protease activity HflC (stomatin/prohibitin superfamily)
MPQIPTIPKGLLWLGGVISAVLLFFILCFRTVGVGQVGIITSFGHVTSEVQSGVVLKAPWPFQQLYKFDIRTQKDQAEAAAASSDLQDVKATLVTNYHINPDKVGELYRTVGTDYKTRLIDPAIQESVKATTANYAIADLITKRQDVKNAALLSLRNRLATRGIIVEDISFVNLEFSKAFTTAIEQKQVAEQQAQQAKYLAEKATNEAAAKVAEAKGQAEAQSIVQASLTPELLQKMSIDKWNGVLPQVTSGGTPFINLK